MTLPFTHEQFLDLFGAYNRDLWPLIALLWLVTLLIFGWTLRSKSHSSRLVPALLAFHWAWTGIVYHLIYFRTINAAAVVFGFLFVVEAVLFVLLGFRKRGLALSDSTSGWHIAGGVLVAYALAYPSITSLSGMRWPRLPLFGVPYPTMVLTAGLLLRVARRDARKLAVIPLLWAAVGGSAAFALGVGPDLALPVSGAILLAYLVMRPSESPRKAA